ncbi:hypothetical protein [Vibrio cholerae]|uniref:hypothetical protein n=1 Tax=Vibrio cholerae TaxID=666 RepID=UPI000F0B802C|nr:hypothetical protein [Vibrio cholerae]EGR5062938.1 hypothetical protein [Vibrio cholerae]RNE59656.1 hypothetical protein EEJ33_00890 [Vibrio cholerae]
MRIIFLLLRSIINWIVFLSYLCFYSFKNSSDFSFICLVGCFKLFDCFVVVFIGFFILFCGFVLVDFSFFYFVLIWLNLFGVNLLSCFCFWQVFLFCNFIE